MMSAYLVRPAWPIRPPTLGAGGHGGDARPCPLWAGDRSFDPTASVVLLIRAGAAERLEQRRWEAPETFRAA